jgi:hypothetical protein
MRLCPEQARSLARMGCHLAPDARASQSERAGTIARRARTIDRWEELPLRIIHLRFVSASMPQSSPARVASQNCLSRSIPNSSLGLRPSSITSTAANSSAFRGPRPKKWNVFMGRSHKGFSPSVCTSPSSIAPNACPYLFLSDRDKFAKKIKCSDTAVSLQRLFEDDGREADANWRRSP